MSSNKQRREAAQRHLQRQLERRAELAQRRKRNMGIVAALVAAVVVAGVVLLTTGVFKGDDKSAAADPSAGSTAASSGAVDGSDGSCDFKADASGNPNLTDVGTPPAKVETTGTTTLTMTTNHGDIGLKLDHANAPCATAALQFLAEKKFFDGTNCHRETNSPGLQVLQCGDPSGSGSGGASFTYPTQVTGKETYPRGTIAMANSGQGNDGSQFFLVYGDSLDNNPNYTVVGTIDDAGLKVLDAIAKKGIAGGGTDGAPAQPVTIKTMTIAG